MTSSEIKTVLLDLILKLDASEMTLNAEELACIETIKETGLDSLSFVDLLFEIEEKFNIQIPTEDLDDILTIDEVVDYIQGKVIAS